MVFTPSEHPLFKISVNVPGNGTGEKIETFYLISLDNNEIGVVELLERFAKVRGLNLDNSSVLATGDISVQATYECGLQDEGCQGRYRIQIEKLVLAEEGNAQLVYLSYGPLYF